MKPSKYKRSKNFITFWDCIKRTLSNPKLYPFFILKIESIKISLIIVTYRVEICNPGIAPSKAFIRKGYRAIFNFLETNPFDRLVNKQRLTICEK